MYVHTSAYFLLFYNHIHTLVRIVKLVHNHTLGATKMCCYNQVVVVTRTFSAETIESVPVMCVAVKRLTLGTFCNS